MGLLLLKILAAGVGCLKRELRHSVDRKYPYNLFGDVR
jgi:hypothetical protein